MIRKITMSLIALMLVFALVSPVFADDSEPIPQVVDEISDYCTSETSVHPGILQLTKIHTMGQEDLLTIMGWFCKEYADLGDIRQALRAAVRDDGNVSIEELKTLLDIPEDEEQNPPPVDPDEGEGEDGDDDMDNKSNSIYCRVDTEKQHPTGLRYAELYTEVLEKVEDKDGTSSDYELIMKWFCDGYGFGQIKHALNTAIQDEVDPWSYLERRANGEGWGVIWKEFGKPAKVHPVFGESWTNGKKNSTQEEGDPVVTSPQNKGKPNKPGK